MFHVALTFEIDLPHEWQQHDLLTDAGDALLPQQVVSSLSEVAAPDRTGQLLIARVLLAESPGEPPLTAGLVVSLAGVDAEPSCDDKAFGAAEVAAMELPVGAGLRVKSLAAQEVLPDIVVPTVLSVQFLVVTDHGLLILTFTTAQGDPAAPWEQLFDAIAATARFAKEH